MSISLATALILAGIGAAAKGTSKGISVYKDGKYQDEVEAYQEKERKKAERASRRAALARAIGADTTFMPQPGEEAPEKPGHMAETLLGAAGDLVGSVGMAAASAPGAIGGVTGKGISRAGTKAMGPYSKKLFEMGEWK